MSQARITRVRLENYKSIKFCDVQLEPITVLVGQNGSGKSNFLDGIFFAVEALISLSSALENRSGFYEIVNKNHFTSAKKPYFRVSLYYLNSRKVEFEYSLKISLEVKTSDKIQIEEILRRNGKVVYSSKDEKPHEIDLIFGNGFEDLKFDESLIDSQKNLSGFKNFLYSLRVSEVLNPIPEAIKTIKTSNIDIFLLKNGSNLASMLLKIQLHNKGVIDKISFYLNLINPNFTRVEAEKIKNSYIFINFFDQSKRSKLNLLNVSSGTARALAILTAILASKYLDIDVRKLKGIHPIIGFEEPELGLHPSAVNIILDAIRSELDNKQFIITTHSPDLLERIDIDSGRETVFAVESKNGETIIAPIDSASREIVRRNLYNLGDLLRMNQLEPEQNPKLVGSV